MNAKGDLRPAGPTFRPYGSVMLDSNIHIGVRGSEPLAESEVDAIVYQCVGEHAGSISAEHGIGILKRAFLDKSRTAQELAAMRLIKQALDPAGILNPGKIFV